VGELNSFHEDKEEVTLTPLNTNRVWIIEQPLIEMYLVLVHRIEGIGLSLDDFWRMDTWVLSKIYLTELELIEKEKKEFKGNKNDPEELNDPATEDLYYEMFGED
jgi:hypothetical protein